SGGPPLQQEVAASRKGEQSQARATPLEGRPAGSSATPFGAERALRDAGPVRDTGQALHRIALHPGRLRLGPYPYSPLTPATVLGLLVLWVVVTGLGLVSPRVLPSPARLAAELSVLIAEGYSGKPLWVHIGASALRTSSGFLLGLAIGIPIGLVIGQSRIIS